mmetsp:Transcript_69093/g.119870  ORF Transcript_69093/g.119870 Transcript_69093/m.119870 type:complete len:115 (-) Transcript_69093:166-510(-)
MKERMANIGNHDLSNISALSVDACSTPPKVNTPMRCFSLDLIEHSGHGTPGAPRFGTATPECPQAEAPPASLLPRTAWTGKGLDKSLPLLSRSELVNNAEPCNVPAPEKFSSPI